MRSLKKSGLQRDSNPWPTRYRCDGIFKLLLSNCSSSKFTAMIILHFDLHPQLKYELFHIYFTSSMTLSDICGSKCFHFIRTRPYTLNFTCQKCCAKTFVTRETIVWSKAMKITVKNLGSFKWPIGSKFPDGSHFFCTCLNRYTRKIFDDLWCNFLAKT